MSEEFFFGRGWHDADGRLSHPLSASYRDYSIQLERAGEGREDVTEKVVALFRRILELSPEAAKAQVRENARNHFGIELGTTDRSIV